MTIEQTALRIDAATGAWRVEEIFDPGLLGPVDYGLREYLQDPDVFVFGGGLLAGSRIPGTRRLICVARSPAWEGFYVSTLGGAAYVFHRVGVDYVRLEHACPVDSVLILNNVKGEIRVRFEPLEPDPIWQGYGGEFGFYALQQAVFEKYKGEYDGDWVRVLATGPGARHTRIGAIGSAQVKRGALTGVDEWAGRGGLGSRLLQHHRICAIVVGGDFEHTDLKDSEELDRYFQTKFGLPMMKADVTLSEKYRYVPEFDTGGTFGVNYELVDDNVLAFNYTTVFESDENRNALAARAIRGHYLAQFNAEIVEPRHFNHCGEPCAVTCKKMGPADVADPQSRLLYKKDYEPYSALGPQLGIFDQRYAEKLARAVDALGVDAIEFGCTLAWLFELLDRGLVPPEDLGLDARPRWTRDPWALNVMADSAHNARLAHALASTLLFDERGAPFRAGVRLAARALEQRYGFRAADYIPYSAHGDEGAICPNQYWVPGMFAPMAIMGRYFENYSNQFFPPRVLGRKNAERMVHELYSENGGCCRFHRRWVEKLFPEIVNTHYHQQIDYAAHHLRLAARIHALEGARTKFWESARIVDMIQAFLEKWQRFPLFDVELDAWVTRFHDDRPAAARAFWDEMLAGMEEIFAQADLGAAPPPDAAADAVLRPNPFPEDKPPSGP
jgi:glyceraldehyde-3-phosphate dehydrogenase (ferredoxin)